MADGRKRPGPPEDSSSSRTKQRFRLSSNPDTRRRNMKAIAGGLVVLGMFLTPGSTPYAPKTRAPFYEPHRMTWSEFREDLHRRHALVWAVAVLLYGSVFTIRKKRHITLRSIIMQTLFHGNPGKKEEIEEITSPIRTALKTPPTSGRSTRFFRILHEIKLFIISGFLFARMWPPSNS